MTCVSIWYHLCGCLGIQNQVSSCYWLFFGVFLFFMILRCWVPLPPGILLSSDDDCPCRNVAMGLTRGTGLRTTSWSWKHHTLDLPWLTTRPTGHWRRVTSVTTGMAMMPAASGRPSQPHTASCSTNSGQLGSVRPTYTSDSVSGVL